MGFNTALNSTQYGQIRSSSYYGEYLVTFCKNTVVFAGQINSDLTTPLTWASFAYNNVSVGAYTNVVVGQALLISTTNDLTTATFRGRIRLIPTSSIIYCNESSQDFGVGNYFWVINTFDPTYRLSRPDSNGNELIDFDLPYQPDPAIAPTLKNAFVDYVDSGTGKMRVAFDVSDAYASASGATISSYLFKFATSSYTVISGSLSTAIVTVDFNPGEQWGLLTITDSNGVAWDRHIYINAHDASNPPDSGFDSLTITGDLQRGWSLTNMAFTGVNNVLNDTFAVVWRHNENFGGIAGALTTNNIAFIGWVQRENDNLATDATYSVLSDAQFQITGVLAQMNRLSAQLLAFSLNSSPSAWSQIANLTPWRGIIHFLAYYTTFLNICGIDFDLKDTTYLFPEITTQGGNVQAVVTGIAAQIDANLETSPDGRIRVDIDAAFLTNLGQAALTTVAAYQAQDCLQISKAIEQNNTYGIVDADGASYNPNNAQVTAFTARAPGHAQGEAQGKATLPNQILVSNGFTSAALVDLRTRAGNEYNKLNMSEVLTVDHFDGLSCLIPSRAQLFTFTLDGSIPGTNGVARIIYTTDVKWLLESVTYTLQPNGGMKVSGVYRRLPAIGDLGDDTTLIAPNEIPQAITDPGLPAFNFELPEFTFPDFGADPTVTPVAPSVLTPPAGQVATLTGQELVVFDTTGTHCYYLRNFITLTRPTAREVTPPDLGSFTIVAVAVGIPTTSAVPCHLLANIVGNSAVWYTPNIAAPMPMWTKGANIAGVYTEIRQTSTAHKIMLCSPGSASSVTQTFDFTISDGGFARRPGGYNGGTWVPGVGWTCTDNSVPGRDVRNCDIELFIASTTINPAVMTYTLTAGTLAFPGDAGAVVNSSLISEGSLVNGSGQTLTDSSSFTTSNIQLYLICDDVVTGNPRSGSGVITKLVITSMTSANSSSIYSTDDGATWGSPQTIGASPGAHVGFDVQRAGTVNYGAMTGKIRKATTIGGAYADFAATTGANPVCCIIPYYRRNTNTLITSVSDPDVIVALDGNDSDGHALYWVNGTTAVKTNIEPVANIVFDSPDCVMVRGGYDLVCFGKVSSVYKLYYSTNGGTSWTFVKNLTAPTEIRKRRNDTRLSGSPARGQVYLADSNMYYSSYLAGPSPAGGGVWVRNMPDTIIGFDTVY